MKKTNLRLNIIFILGFIMLLAFPVVAKITGFPADYQATDNRTLAQFPQLDLKHLTNQDLMSFPGRYEQYLNDNFGLRNVMIRIHSQFSLAVFNKPAVSSVLLGKDGWYFFADDNTAIDSSRGYRLFSNNQLQQFQKTLEERRDWLKTLGSNYYFLVAPNTLTIYPEFAPDSIPKLGSTTMYQQLQEQLDQHSTVQTINLYPDLIKAKSQDVIYYKNDSHWNTLGAFTAYQDIAKRLSIDYPNIKTLTKEDFKIEPQNSKINGDLTFFLSLPQVGSFPDYQFTPIKNSNVTKLPSNDPKVMIFENADKSLPKAVLIHDSYSLEMIPFLTSHFSRLVMISSSMYFDDKVEKLIAQEKPDLVVQETVERFLTSELPVNSELIKQK